MKRFLTFISILLCFNFAYSQILVNQSWEALTGKPSDSIRYSVSTIDVDENLIIVGNTYVPGDDENYLITKYDKNGNLEWQKEFNYISDSTDFGTAVVTDDNGDVYVTGASYDLGSGGFDYITLMLDGKDGDLNWYVKYSGQLNDIPTAMTIDEDKNIYVTGTSESVTTGYDYLTAMYDSTGQEIWTARYDYDSLMEIATGIVIDQYDKITVTGGSAKDSVNWEYATIQYDQSGSLSSEERTTAGQVGVDNPSAIINDEEGNIYITGSYLNTSGDRDIKIMKIDTSFEVEWVKTYDFAGFDDKANDIAVDDSSNVFICGYITNLYGGRDFITLKFDGSGTEKWANVLNTSHGNNNTEALAIISDTSHNIFITGKESRNSQDDIITVRYSNDGNLTWVKYFANNGAVDDTPTKITADETGNVYVIGITEEQGQLTYVTLQYSQIDRDMKIASPDSIIPIEYVEGELLVQFDTSVVLTQLVDNKDIYYGTLSDFIEPSFIDTINEAFENAYDFGTFNTFKVFNRMTTADTLSITRLGDTIRLHSFWATFVVKLPTALDEYPSSEIMNTLSPGVYFAELNLIGKKFDLPNDPEFVAENQDGLQASYTTDRDIEMDRAWNIYHGSQSAKVGIFDTGLEWSHEDFHDDVSLRDFASSKIVGGWDFWKSRHIRFDVHDDDGHGTRSAGIIGAIRNNNTGVAGIAGGDWLNNNTGCQLFGFKILNDNASFGTGNTARTSIDLATAALIEGSVVSSTNPPYGYGLNVLNCSWGLEDGKSPNFKPSNKSLFYQATKEVFHNNALLVFAQGNNGDDGKDESIPTTTVPDEFLMSIGGSQHEGIRHEDSNYGFNIDVIAPYGVGGSETPFIETTDNNDTGYTQFVGTSASAPHVAGVAALMYSYTVDLPGLNAYRLSNEDMEFLIQRYAVDITSPSPYTIGWDEESGWGRLDAGSVMEHLEWPFFRVKHYHRTTQNSLAVQVGFNETRFLQGGTNFLAEGYYIVDVWEVTLNSNHTFGTGTVENAWPRNVGSTLWSNTNPIVPEPRPELVSANSTQCEMKGYIYHFKTDIASNSIDAWYPNELVSIGEFNYSLHIHDPNATGDQIDITEKGVNGIFPNPANDKHTILFNSSLNSNTTIKLVDLLGKEIKRYSLDFVKEGQQIEVDISDLIPGIYFYSINSEYGKESIKFIKY